MRLRSFCIALILSSAIALSACGGGGDSDNVSQTLQTYLAALAQGNGKEACDQMTGDQARRMLQEAAAFLPELQPTSCADALSKLGGSLGGEETEALESAEVTNMKIDGDSATAELVGGTQTAKLTKNGDLWLISGGIGISP